MIYSNFMSSGGFVGVLCLFSLLSCNFLLSNHENAEGANVTACEGNTRDYTG